MKYEAPQRVQIEFRRTNSTEWKAGIYLQSLAEAREIVRELESPYRKESKLWSYRIGPVADPRTTQG